MDIQKHPVWDHVSPYKKPAHLLRFTLARRFAAFFPSSKFIGITGSVGKTTTALACKAVLEEKLTTVSTQESLDSIFNIPITVLKVRPKIKKVILEMGVEYPGEMDFYLSIVSPATAIVTKISFAHSEFLGGIEEIANEKAKLVRQLPKEGFAILNGDDVNTRKLAKETSAQVLFYGIDGKNCDVWASQIRLEGSKTVFELNYGVERVEVVMNLLGRHMVYPALAAAALGVSCGFSLITVKRGLEKIKPAPHRMQIMEGLEGWNVLDDTYNSSPAAVEEAINVLNELPGRRRIVVLGEMRELGPYSQQLHRSVAGKIYKEKPDFVLLGGGDARFIGDELLKLGFSPERMEVNLSNSQMVNRILKIAGKGDLILVKGSHAVKLDEVVKRITKKP